MAAEAAAPAHLPLGRTEPPDNPPAPAPAPPAAPAYLSAARDAAECAFSAARQDNSRPHTSELRRQSAVALACTQ